MKQTLKKSPLTKRSTPVWLSAGVAALAVGALAVAGSTAPFAAAPVLSQPYERYVNAGCAESTGWHDRTWEADQPYAPGGWGFVGSDYNTGQPEGSDPILDASGEAFGEGGQRLHGCRAQGTDFGYRFDLPNGEYHIRLRFVEPVSEPGQRRFDVAIEGQVVLDDYDVAAAAGGLNVAVQERFPALVEDGQLQIDFIGGQGSEEGAALVQALAVEQVSGVEEVTPAPEETAPPQEATPAAPEATQEPPATTEPQPEAATPTPEVVEGTTEPQPEATAEPPTPTPDPALNNPAPTVEPAATDAPPADAQTPAPSGGPVYVNAGQCGAVTWAGITWAADQPYAPGSWGHVGSDFHAVDATVAGPVLDETGAAYGDDGQTLHRCQVYGRDFGYHFDLPAGEYVVRLRFAEPLYAPGERKFDVAVEGQTVLDDYDVSAAAGGAGIALERAFQVNVTDGTLNVDFSAGQGGSQDDNAFVQALSVVPGSTAPAADSPAAPAADGTADQNTAQAEPAAQAAAAAPAYVQYVNVGPCKAVSWDGVTWAKDRTYAAGSWGHVGPDWNGRKPGQAMIKDEAGVLYTGDAQTLHRCRAFGTNFGYRFDVPNGDYLVRLRFAEPSRPIGKRFFDVGIEGVLALDNFDIAAAAGGTGIAVERDFLVTVSDGQLTLDFVGRQAGSVDINAIVQAIGVIAQGTTPPPPPPPPGPTPTPQPGPTATPMPGPTPTRTPTPQPPPPGRMMPYGPFHWPDAQWTNGTYTATMDTLSPGNAITRLEAARRAGVSIFINLAGGRDNFQEADGAFSVSKFAARLQGFAGIDFAPYVADGTIAGHLLFDEPQDPNNWNGKSVPYADIDAAAAASKALWPTMPAGPSGPPSFLSGGAPYQYVDFGLAQYSARRGAALTWMNTEVSAAKSAGLGVVLSINVLHGGTTAQTNVTATQLLDWGMLFVNEPYACGLLMWKYDEADSGNYLKAPDVTASVASIAQAARLRTPNTCNP